MGGYESFTEAENGVLEAIGIDACTVPAGDYRYLDLIDCGTNEVTSVPSNPKAAVNINFDVCKPTPLRLRWDPTRFA